MLLGVWSPAVGFPDLAYLSLASSLGRKRKAPRRRRPGISFVSFSITRGQIGRRRAEQKWLLCPGAHLASSVGHYRAPRSVSNPLSWTKNNHPHTTNVIVFLAHLRRPTFLLGFSFCSLSRLQEQLKLPGTFHHKQVIVTQGDIWLWTPKELGIGRLESLTASCFQKAEDQALRESEGLKTLGEEFRHFEGHLCGFLKRILGTRMQDCWNVHSGNQGSRWPGHIGRQLPGGEDVSPCDARQRGKRNWPTVTHQIEFQGWQDNSLGKKSLFF